MKFAAGFCGTVAGLLTLSWAHKKYQEWRSDQVSWQSMSSKFQGFKMRLERLERGEREIISLLGAKAAPIYPSRTWCIKCGHPLDSGDHEACYADARSALVELARELTAESSEFPETS